MHIDAISAARKCHQWLVKQALPHWAAQGFDRDRGLFAEGLDATGHAYWQPTRFRVQGRQIYVFSHATQLGWFDGRALAVQCGLEGMVRFHNAVGYDVFALTQEGGVADGTLCCYEYAFALLGECWLYRLTGDAHWQRQAERRYLVIESLFADQRHGGFHSTSPASVPRSQNPHMHLFEALLVASESFPDPKWQGRATALYRLFRQRFLEPVLLREFFDETLMPRHPDSRLIDPGHHYEWCWLLERYRVLSQDWENAPASAEIDECLGILTTFARAHGHGPTGLVMDEVTEQGEPWRATSRLWCQTEHLKALLAVYEFQPEEKLARQIADVVEHIFQYYITPALPGQWIDQVDPDGRPLAYNAPASTFYHIFVAFSELARVAGIGDESLR